ncbi:hypothetical protein HK098_003182 [Nowakowskiella sp. JEL0407]|nr:hypothetical protein HK098_003182 [Nowakowskiella sp. JEL0407]
MRISLNSAFGLSHPQSHNRQRLFTLLLSGLFDPEPSFTNETINLLYKLGKYNVYAKSTQQIELDLDSAKDIVQFYVNSEFVNCGSLLTVYKVRVSDRESLLKYVNGMKDSRFQSKVVRIRNLICEKQEDAIPLKISPEVNLDSFKDILSRVNQLVYTFNNGGKLDRITLLKEMWVMYPDPNISFLIVYVEIVHLIHEVTVKDVVGDISNNEVIDQNWNIQTLHKAKDDVATRRSARKVENVFKLSRVNTRAEATDIGNRGVCDKRWDF